MIQMFNNGHLAAGILGVIATVGWVIQGLGNAFYYQQVGKITFARGLEADAEVLDMGPPYGCRSLCGKGKCQNP